MKPWKRELIFPFAGLLTIIILTAANGANGTMEAAAATLVCSLPLLFDIVRAKVAERAHASKIPLTQGMIALPQGMLFRLAVVLGVAAALYQSAKDRLGIGYWLAVVVLYQVGLAVIAMRSIARLR